MENSKIDERIDIEKINSRIINLSKLNFLMRLRIVKAIKNWSSYELAKAIGISPVTLSRYENKKSTPKTLAIMDRIEEVERKALEELNKEKEKK